MALDVSHVDHAGCGEHGVTFIEAGKQLESPMQGRAAGVGNIGDCQLSRWVVTSNAGGDVIIPWVERFGKVVARTGGSATVELSPGAARSLLAESCCNELLGELIVVEAEGVKAPDRPSLPSDVSAAVLKRLDRLSVWQVVGLCEDGEQWSRFLRVVGKRDRDVVEVRVEGGGTLEEVRCLFQGVVGAEQVSGAVVLRFSDEEARKRAVAYSCLVGGPAVVRVDDGVADPDPLAELLDRAPSWCAARERLSQLAPAQRRALACDRRLCDEFIGRFPARKLWVSCRAQKPQEWLGQFRPYGRVEPPSYDARRRMWVMVPGSGFDVGSALAGSCMFEVNGGPVRVEVEGTPPDEPRFDRVPAGASSRLGQLSVDQRRALARDSQLWARFVAHFAVLPKLYVRMRGLGQEALRELAEEWGEVAFMQVQADVATVTMAAEDGVRKAIRDSCLTLRFGGGVYVGKSTLRGPRQQRPPAPAPLTETQLSLFDFLSDDQLAALVGDAELWDQWLDMARERDRRMVIFKGRDLTEVRLFCGRVGGLEAARQLRTGQVHVVMSNPEQAERVLREAALQDVYVDRPAPRPGPGPRLLERIPGAAARLGRLSSAQQWEILEDDELIARFCKSPGEVLVVEPLSATADEIRDLFLGFGEVAQVSVDGGGFEVVMALSGGATRALAESCLRTWEGNPVIVRCPGQEPVVLGHPLGLSERGTEWLRRLSKWQWRILAAGPEAFARFKAWSSRWPVGTAVVVSAAAIREELMHFLTRFGKVRRMSGDGPSIEVEMATAVDADTLLRESSHCLLNGAPVRVGLPEGGTVPSRGREVLDRAVPIGGLEWLQALSAWQLEGLADDDQLWARWLDAAAERAPGAERKVLRVFAGQLGLPAVRKMFPGCLSAEWVEKPASGPRIARVQMSTVGGARDALRESCLMGTMPLRVEREAVWQPPDARAELVAADSDRVVVAWIDGLSVWQRRELARDGELWLRLRAHVRSQSGATVPSLPQAGNGSSRGASNAAWTCTAEERGRTLHVSIGRADPQELEAYFSRFGHVARVWVSGPRQTGRFARIVMGTAAECDAAITGSVLVRCDHATLRVEREHTEHQVSDAQSPARQHVQQHAPFPGVAEELMRLSDSQVEALAANHSLLLQWAAAHGHSAPQQPRPVIEVRRASGEPQPVADAQPVTPDEAAEPEQVPQPVSAAQPVVPPSPPPAPLARPAAWVAPIPRVAAGVRLMVELGGRAASGLRDLFQQFGRGLAEVDAAGNARLWFGEAGANDRAFRGSTSMLLNGEPLHVDLEGQPPLGDARTLGCRSGMTDTLRAWLAELSPAQRLLLEADPAAWSDWLSNARVATLSSTNIPARTLTVRAALLDAAQLAEFFSEYGRVADVAIDQERAAIVMGTRGEARAAVRGCTRRTIARRPVAAEVGRRPAVDPLQVLLAEPGLDEAVAPWLTALSPVQRAELATDPDLWGEFVAFVKRGSEP